LAFSLIGFPHSFCSPTFEGFRSSERAEEDDISDTLEAVEAEVEERGRPATRGSVGGGSGTESIIVWAFWKAVWR